jgi:hypothetical protein
MSDLLAAPADLGLRFGVFEHDESFPFIAVRVACPGLVLESIAAIDLHLVNGHKPGLDPSFADSEDVFGRCDLKPEVRERSAFREGHFIKDKVERRFCDVELGVTESRASLSSPACSRTTE